jgi:SHS2 domain-containing protein
MRFYLQNAPYLANVIIMNKLFDILPHTADITLRARGSTQAELFKNSLLGMFAFMDPKFSKQRPTTQQFISVCAPDTEAVLIAFLAEALYLSTTHYEAYTDARILQCNTTECSAELMGSPIIGYEGPEIKAVTYHDVQVIHTDSLWQATVTFDI